MKKLILLLALFTVGTVAAFETFDLSKVASMQKRQDGRYNVICKTGNFEVVTDLDITLNNVCPHLTSTESLEIIAMQMRDDGKFDVMCSDYSRYVASREEILMGQVCRTKRVQLEDGEYKAIKGHTSYYDQTIRTQHDKRGVLTHVKITLKANKWNASLQCEDNVCIGKSSSGRKTTIEVLDKIRYKYIGSSNAAIFTKIN